jgi:sulfate transport system substrate-binding protein
MERVVEAGLVDKGWKDTEHDGLVTTSVVSFIVRKGNPKNIRPGTTCSKRASSHHAHPFTSGAAKWNLLGAYQHGGLGVRRQAHQGPCRGSSRSPPRGAPGVRRRRGRRAALLRVRGDNRAEEGRGRRVRHPARHAEIDITIAKTKKAPEAAQTFLSYLQGDAAQQRFADWGYRP